MALGEDVQGLLAGLNGSDGRGLGTGDNLWTRHGDETWGDLCICGFLSVTNRVSTREKPQKAARPGSLSRGHEPPFAL